MIKNIKTKNIVYSFIILTFITFSNLGCQNDNSAQNEAKVEMYMLDVYSTVNNGCQIDELTTITKEDPVIRYIDFLSYDPAEYTFELSSSAVNNINSLEHSVNGLAFAITVNNTIVYTGYFWPSYSSASCNWAVIDPLMLTAGSKITVQLGYPGPGQGSIPDKRNDSRIISIFKNDNKLIQ